jgi:hypothetical protein
MTSFVMYEKRQGWLPTCFCYRYGQALGLTNISCGYQISLLLQPQEKAVQDVLAGNHGFA